ncbi:MULTISPECIES: IS66 family insertion sequence element accessory protein TnpB [unclassified Paenibacillus]|uniref:IS66 family insertion sequence element accessory protein TnpB n=1 Tax=unclassified Paenibacillus TaxID=185978 RepID=UPI00363B634B
MLTLANIDRVYLACGSTDLRKSIDGLAALVQAGFELDPFSSSLFVFCNRQRDKLRHEKQPSLVFLLWRLTMDRVFFAAMTRFVPEPILMI